MSDPIVLISHNRIKEGKLDDLRQFTPEGMKLIEADKPGTLVQLAYVNEDGTEVTYIHLFANKAQPGVGRLFDGSPGWFSYKINCMKLKAYRLDDKYAQITTGSEGALFNELSSAYEKGLPIRGYGVMMLLAVLAGTGLAVWRGRRMGLDPDLIVSLTFWMFVPGILGARISYVVEYWPDQYWPVYQQNGLPAILVAVINVTEGGLVVYGALLGGVLGLVLFVRKYRLPLLATCDLITPSLMLGLALGRIGCLLNGCW